MESAGSTVAAYNGGCVGLLTFLLKELRDESLASFSGGGSGGREFAGGNGGYFLAVDPVHSSAIFRIKHANTSYLYGRINAPEGKVEYDAAKPEAS